MKRFTEIPVSFSSGVGWTPIKTTLFPAFMILMALSISCRAEGISKSSSESCSEFGSKRASLLTSPSRFSAP